MPVSAKTNDVKESLALKQLLSTCSDQACNTARSGASVCACVEELHAGTPAVMAAPAQYQWVNQGTYMRVSSVMVLHTL